MKPETVHTALESVGSTDKEAFVYQLDFLKLEFAANNVTIGRIDEITSKLKNWAILTWAGSITLTLGHLELRKYLGVTAVLPLPFFFVESWMRRIQRSFIFRINKISDFLNDGRLQRSFQERKLVDFRVVDPRATQHRATHEYKRFTTLWGTMAFREVAAFYLGLSLLSIVIWWIVSH